MSSRSRYVMMEQIKEIEMRFLTTEYRNRFDNPPNYLRRDGKNVIPSRQACPKESQIKANYWIASERVNHLPDTSPSSNIAKQTHRTRANPAKVFHRTHGLAGSQSGRSKPKERSIASN